MKPASSCFVFFFFFAPFFTSCYLQRTRVAKVVDSQLAQQQLHFVSTSSAQFGCRLSNSLHKIKIIFKIYCASSSFKIGFKVEGRKRYAWRLNIFRAVYQSNLPLPLEANWLKCLQLCSMVLSTYLRLLYPLDPHLTLSHLLSPRIRLGHWELSRQCPQRRCRVANAAATLGNLLTCCHSSWQQRVQQEPKEMKLPMRKCHFSLFAKTQQRPHEQMVR